MRDDLQVLLSKYESLRHVSLDTMTHRTQSASLDSMRQELGSLPFCVRPGRSGGSSSAAAADRTLGVSASREQARRPCARFEAGEGRGNETTRLDEALEALSAQGRERGFVAPQDLLQGLPVQDLSPEQVEGFLIDVQEYLRKEGIEVLDPEGASEKEAEEPRGIRRGSSDVPVSDPVRMYLKEIDRIPLLTASQEVDLAMRREAGGLAAELLASVDSAKGVDEKAFRIAVASVVRIREHQLDPKENLAHEGIGLEKMTRVYRPRTRTEATQFLRRMEGDGRTAKKRLIEANLRLVVSIAKRYHTGGMAFLDLTQEGNLGLIRAVDKFDYTRGYKFSTCATWWIRQAITRAIADQSRTIRLPAHITDLLSKITRAQPSLTQGLGREPLPGEIGRQLGMTGERVREILGVSRDPLSLETPIGKEQGSYLGDLIEDSAAVPVDAVSFLLLQEQLESVLCTLSERERRVIQLRFGLLDGHPRTLEDVGREFHLSRERIRQIEARTLSKLRHPSRSQKLRDYLE